MWYKLNQKQTVLIIIDKISTLISMMKLTTSLLTTITLLHTALSLLYIPGRAFNSYQIQITNLVTPGTDLDATNNGNTFTLPLNDVHNNVNHHAIAFTGYSNPSNSTEMAFELTVVSNTSTQYVLSLGIYGVSAIRQLNFALILIGNQGTGAIEAACINQSMNIYSTVGLNSSLFTYTTTSVTAPNKVLAMFSGFRAKQQAGQNKFYIAIYPPTRVGQVISYRYATNFGTRIYWASLVLLIYNSTASVMAAPHFNYNSGAIYPSAINTAHNAAPANSYLQGYNQKCLFSLRQFYARINQRILIDLNYPSPGFNISVVNSYSYSTTIFCYLRYNCSVIDPQCTECISQTNCSQCNPSYYVQITPINVRQCFLCRDVLHGCLNCSDSANCTACDAPYVLNGTECRVANCLYWTSTPTNITCTLCIDRYYLLGSLCFFCSIPKCLTCSMSTGTLDCLICEAGYFPLNSSCVFCSVFLPKCLTCSTLTGTLQCLICEQVYRNVPGGCTDIVGCASIDTSSQLCLSCYSTFQGLSNNICQCSGRVISDICTTDPGCIVPYVERDGSVSCSFCDSNLMFATFPVNKRCVCKQKFYIVGGQCQEICGDGFNMGFVECDDGNIIDGDGCSSKCAVQIDYRCTEGSSIDSSVCVYVKRLIDLTLTSIKKNGDLNQGLFSFAVYPPLLNIKKMDLKSFVKLNCTINEIISDITYDYTGKLTLTVSYTTDLEGMPCNMTFAFNNSIIENSDIILTFDAISETLPLKIVQNEEKLKTTNTIFKIFSYIGVAIFLLSLGHKMIGAQLITNLQIVCLSNVLYHKGYFFFNEVRRLEAVTGLWSMFHQEQDSNFMPPFSQRVDMTPFFLENTVIVMSVLVPVTIIFILFKRTLHVKTVAITDVVQPEKLQENPPIELIRLSFIVKVIYQMLVFPLSAGFMLVLMLSCQIEITFVSTRVPTFPTILSSISILLSSLILANVCSTELIVKKSELSGLTGAEGWYIPLFLIRSILIENLILLGSILKNDSFIYYVVGIQGFYFVTVIFGGPYKKYRKKVNKLDNIGVILIEATALYAVGLPLAMRFVEVSELYEYFMVLVLQGMIMIAMVLSLIRLLVHYSTIIRNCLCPQIKTKKKKKTKKSQLQIKEPAGGADKTDNLREEDDVVREMKMINPYSLYHQNISKGIKVDQEQKNKNRLRMREIYKAQQLRRVREEKEEYAEDPELAACKQRLREKLFQKRQRENKQ